MAVDAPALAMSGAAGTLVVLGGLPGSGKTTIARSLAHRSRATWLRIDAIEQAIRDAGLHDPGTAGYGVAQALAAGNLGPGRLVIADCVNPVRESRAGWRAVAARAGARLVEVHILCSDAAEHRRRVEARRADIPGLVLPGWEAIAALPFAPWPEAALRLDTALLSAEAAVRAIEAALAEQRLGP